jgi:hypothetical protein
MRKTQPLLTLFNSQCAVCARVCLPRPTDECQNHMTPLPSQKIYRRRSQLPATGRLVFNAALPSAILPLRCNPHSRSSQLLRGLVQPRFIPLANCSPPYMKLDCLQPLGIKRYTLDRSEGGECGCAHCSGCPERYCSQQVGDGNGVSDHPRLGAAKRLERY